jgi:arsenate reductase (thioredoxin)
MLLLEKNMAQKPRVLFLCTGNSARSQMAEAILSKIAGESFEVYSAGLEPKGVHPKTIQVLKEIGIDWSQAQSKSLNEFLGKIHFGFLITVCSRAEEKCPIFPGMGQRLHWPFDDPAAVQGSEADQLAAFRSVRDQIEAKIGSWLAELN